MKCSLPSNPNIFYGMYIKVYLIGDLRNFTPDSASCSQSYLKCVCLLSDFCLSFYLRVEEADPVGTTCLRPTLLWGVVRCRLAVRYLHKRSSKMGPTRAETSLINIPEEREPRLHRGGILT